MPDIHSLTVLICTYNRAPLLRETLAALALARQPESCRVDIVVVDNNSTDQTQDVLREAMRTCRYPVTVVVETPRGIDARTQELFRELGRLLPEPPRGALRRQEPQ